MITEAQREKLEALRTKREGREKVTLEVGEPAYYKDTDHKDTDTMSYGFMISFESEDPGKCNAYNVAIQQIFKRPDVSIHKEDVAKFNEPSRHVWELRPNTSTHGLTVEDFKKLLPDLVAQIEKLAQKILNP